MVDPIWIILAVCLAIVAYVLRELANSGVFAKIEPIVTESPSFFSTPTTVYYKYHLGPYSDTGNVVTEAKEILPKGSTPFGIFYDNPEVVPSHLLQSAVGVIFSENGEDLYSDNYAQQLTRFGYEKMTLAAVPRAVQATQPNGGLFSLFALIFRTYGIIKQYIEANRLETTVSIEVYAKDRYCILFPLDDFKSYTVPEYKTQDELESDMAKKKFDSDESDSESEAEPTEQDDEARMTGDEADQPKDQ